MSDVMLFGVLRMPFELAMSDDVSRAQFYQRAQQAADRIEELERQLAASNPAPVEQAAPQLPDNEDNPVTLWAEIHRLRSELEGPAGFTSWRDAAVDERVRRVEAERKLKSQAAPVTVPHEMPYGAFDNRFQDGWNACRQEMLKSLAAAPAVPSADAQDAAKYRWLLEQTWDQSQLCVVMRPKEAVRVGMDCPYGKRLDAIIRAAVDAALSAKEK